MKTLNTYITEWKANSSTVFDIKHNNKFIYKVKNNSEIKIFGDSWPQIKNYKYKVYIDGKHIELDDYGWTIKKYESGTYIVDIKDIDNVTNCQCMFYFCDQLISVPLFDTSKVDDMWQMFFRCKNLKNVPLLNTNKVESMTEMFAECDNLNEKTKNIWSKLYDFEYNEMKK